METVKYQVECGVFKPCTADLVWVLHDEFDSLGEAMASATERSLTFMQLKHRVCKTVVVMEFPALEETTMDKEKKEYLIVYHYDGEDVDTLVVTAKSTEHAIDLAHEQLALRAEREGSAHEYYLDLLIDPNAGGKVLERL